MTGPTDPLVSLDGVEASHAIEVAPRIWWVGTPLEHDPFQCHAYLIEAGDHSVLVDPGSTLTIDTTLRKVAEVVPLDHIETILLHHSDPDVCDALHVLDQQLARSDVHVLTEWRSALLLRHLGVRFRYESIEDRNWHLELGDGRTLHFLLTPYLHFPGAFVTFDESTRTLLSSDLFGGFNRARRLWAKDAADFEDLRQFHEHYMPSRDILIAGLGTIVNRFSPIDRVFPQHGYLIPGDLVRPMFEQLSRLECGIMLASKSDSHLAQLLAVAATLRRIEDILDTVVPLEIQLGRVEEELRSLVPLEELWVEADDNGTLLRFDHSSPAGTLIDTWTSAGDLHVVLPITDDVSTLPLHVVLSTTAPFSPIPELATMLSLVSTRAHHVVAEAIERRSATALQQHLRSAAETDALTGLENRRALDALTVAKGSAAILMIDIDHFKVINDEYGHQAGDEVLRAVAAAIRTTLRRSDRAFRYGGEEFVIVAPTDAHETGADAVAMAERLRTAVASIDTAQFGLTRPVTVSVGVASVDSDASLRHHLERADHALYDAKRTGRNRVVSQSSELEGVPRS